MEAALSEQQRIYLKQGSLDSKKLGFYVLAMPSDELASLCVVHIMRHLLGEFLSNTNTTAATFDQTKEIEVDFSSIDVKIKAITLFSDLGKLVDKQLKQKMLDKTSKEA